MSKTLRDGLNKLWNRAIQADSGSDYHIDSIDKIEREIRRLVDEAVGHHETGSGETIKWINIYIDKIRKNLKDKGLL